jgi:site-specific recombinase XerD
MLNAGITKPITFHSSRHTFATLLLTKGVDLYTVSKLLGHQDIATTLVYAKVIDKVKDGAVEMLPIFDIGSC